MHRFLTALMLCLTATLCLADTTKSPRARRPLRSTRFGSTLLRAGTTKTEKWTWTTTVTTNELEQITKISTGISTNGITNVVCFVWNDNVVPFKYRNTFLSLTDEQKMNALGDVAALWTENPTPAPVYPKEVKKRDGETDENLTEEVREVQLRW